MATKERRKLARKVGGLQQIAMGRHCLALCPHCRRRFERRIGGSLYLRALALKHIHKVFELAHIVAEQNRWCAPGGKRFGVGVWPIQSIALELILRPWRWRDPRRLARLISRLPSLAVLERMPEPGLSDGGTPQDAHWEKAKLRYYHELQFVNELLLAIYGDYDLWAPRLEAILDSCQRDLLFNFPVADRQALEGLRRLYCLLMSKTQIIKR
jgi:hypothetical protein